MRDGLHTCQSPKINADMVQFEERFFVVELEVSIADTCLFLLIYCLTFHLTWLLEICGTATCRHFYTASQKRVCNSQEIGCDEAGRIKTLANASMAPLFGLLAILSAFISAVLFTPQPLFLELPQNSIRFLRGSTSIKDVVFGVSFPKLRNEGILLHFRSL